MHPGNSAPGGGGGGQHCSYISSKNQLQVGNVTKKVIAIMSLRYFLSAAGICCGDAISGTFIRQNLIRALNLITVTLLGGRREAAHGATGFLRGTAAAHQRDRKPHYNGVQLPERGDCGRGS